MSEIEICIPKLNAKEISYTFDVLLNNILKLKNYHFSYSESIKDFKIILPNNGTITIANHFFAQRDFTSYNKSDLPNELNSYMGRDTELLFFYGDSHLSKIENEIKIGFDIIASSFFMLSRWEESCLDEFDEHNRFKGSASFAVKKGFIDRPIVNEYAEFLLNLFNEFECIQEDQRSFEIIPTHDIDSIYKYPTRKSKIKAAVSSVIKKQNSNKLHQLLSDQSDSYDTFDYMLEVESKKEIKAYYNVHFRSEGKWNGNYDLTASYVNPLIQKIVAEGHEIGFHPGYDTYNNKGKFAEQLQKAKDILQLDFKSGRQHFLNFELPSTWKIWDDLGFYSESSMYYPEYPGFRCGTCSSFNVFDISTRSKLNLKERPLSFMDVSYTKYLQLSEDACMEKISTTKNRIKKHKGEFVFLWHNSFFSDSQWEQPERVFKFLYE